MTLIIKAINACNIIRILPFFVKHSVFGCENDMLLLKARNK